MTDLTIEPFIGHRVWRVLPDADGPVLAAAMSGDVWSDGDQAAECHSGVMLVPRYRRPRVDAHPGEAIPALACTCGIYASLEPMAPPHRRVWARGRVRLWGRVIEGEKGFRASRARVADDLEILLGMGPGETRCTSPACRAAADRIWQGSTSFLSRCRAHDDGRGVTVGEFIESVDRSVRRRYGVGARLATS